MTGRGEFVEVQGTAEGRPFSREALDGLLDYDDLDDNVRGRLRELLAQSVLTTRTLVFSVSPGMSNPAGEWLADDPEFWRSSPLVQRQQPKK